MLNEATFKYLGKEGVEFLCFSGMENLLEEPCDPLLLGMMQTEGRRGLENVSTHCFSESSCHGTTWNSSHGAPTY